MSYRVDCATKEEWAARCFGAEYRLATAQARIEELEESLEDIGHMGFDMPATLDLTDEAWRRRRAGMMQHIAREALKDTTNE
jgi:hypothetical protein